MTSSPDTELSATLDRRRFLRGALVMGAALAAEHLSISPEADAQTRIQRWSDRRTWGGRLPGRSDVVRITKPVLLDRSVRVAGVIVKPGGALIFHPNKRITLSTSGNVIVHGLLRMRPHGPRDLHRLKFVGIKESRYKGEGMSPLRSDVGLWVIEGALDLAGSPKRAWTRAAGSIPAKTTKIELRRAPTGWRVGDEIVIAPTLPPGSTNTRVFEEATITGIAQRRITLSRAPAHPHPKVEVARGRIMTAEVLNLTRNVVIQGTPGGRAHIFIHSHKRQKISNVDIRFMGPRKNDKDGKFTRKIRGRWPLHFHHCHDGSRGSVVHGVIVRDSGSHAFVPHRSNGIRFKNCIAYKNLETPYWWDEPAKGDPSRTKGTIYDSCVAADINFDPPHRGGTILMGFKMALGPNNKALNCVAVGIRGQAGGDSSGFGWVAHESGVWDMKGCVSHNNANLGSRLWLNNPASHNLEDFVIYHNGRFGSFDGAYTNAARYVDGIYYRNGRHSAIEAKATSGRGVPRARPKGFVGLRIDQAGDSDYCIEFNGHVNDPEGARTVVKNCSFRGYKKAALAFTNAVSESANVPDLVDVIGCSFSGNEFWLGNQIHPRSRIRVQHPRLGTIQLSRWDQILEGTLVLEWNARVKQIDPFG